MVARILPNSRARYASWLLVVGVAVTVLDGANGFQAAPSIGRAKLRASGFGASASPRLRFGPLPASGRRSRLPRMSSPSGSDSEIPAAARPTAALGLDSLPDTDPLPPQRFIRLERIAENKFELQTAVVSYRLPPPAGGEGEEVTVDIVSLVHLADPRYYREIQQFADSKHDRVLFELIADTSLVSTDEQGRRRLSEHLLPAPDQSILAKHHGLQAQLDGMTFDGEKWFLADLDRESITALKAARGESSEPSLLAALSGGWGWGDFKALPRRIPSLLRTWLRTPMWLVPCPEGALLLLDWSLSARGRVSEVLGGMLSSLLSFDLQTCGKLSFAQLLSSGNMRCEGPQTVIIGERNKVAVRELRRALAEGVGSTALLYGGLHGEDLDRRLRGMGFERAGHRWVSAWRVAVPDSKGALSKLAALGGGYMLLDGFDWMTTVQGAAEEVSTGRWNGAAALFLAYLARHGLAYWQMGRLLVSWDTTPFEYVANLEGGGVGSNRPGERGEGGLRAAGGKGEGARGKAGEGRDAPEA